MIGFTGKYKERIKSLENRILNYQEDLNQKHDLISDLELRNEDLETKITSLQNARTELIEQLDKIYRKESEDRVKVNQALDAASKIKDYENTIIEKDKILKTLMEQLKLDKVYSVKGMKCFALMNCDNGDTYKTNDMSVNAIAKTYGVDTSWLTKKLKSGNGVAIVNGIQFVLVRV